MKAMFIPDARDKNSYQTNLSQSLMEKGVNVCFGDNVVQSIIENRPDILHMHWTNYFMIGESRITTIIKSSRFICGLLVLKLFGIKIVWTVHNMVDHEGKFRSLELLFSKILSRLCDKLVVHCPSAKADVEKIYGKDLPIVVIPHGNYIEQYKTDNIVNDNNIEGSPTTFLYFGQIRSYKGVPELIDAFKRLRCHDAKLLIVGKPLDDKISADILNSCKDDYRIKCKLGFIPDEDIGSYMKAADVVVLPYKNVLTSGTVMLAMSFGKAIIAPGYKCIADTLDEKGSFLYSDDREGYGYREENGLFGAMKNALRCSRKNLIDMGKHNFELAKQLGWDDIAKRTCEVYGDICKMKVINEKNCCDNKTDAVRQ